MRTVGRKIRSPGKHTFWVPVSHSDGDVPKAVVKQPEAQGRGGNLGDVNLGIISIK